MATVKDLIALAETEVGYLEKKSNAQLDDKTANAGDKNFTKYSRDLVNLIGGPYSQGSAWCDMFVDWLMIKTFGKEKAKELLGGWSAYTPTSAQYYKNMNRWYTSNPHVGDQIFFKNSTRICHTGIVYRVNDNMVYTIEGNTSSKSGVVPNGGAVAIKSYPLNYIKIAGYGRPNYPVDNKVANTTVKVANKITSTVLSYPCRGIDVAAWQTNLDYQKLKDEGVQFAILKAIRKDNQADDLFEKHYSGFTKVGIPILAVYNYSYAQTVEKAKIDARAVIKVLNGRKIPVCLDVEDKVQQSLGKKLIEIINAYQSVIEEAGLPFIVYTGLSFYHSWIKPYKANLNCNSFWIARYYNGYKEMSINQTLNDHYKPDVPGLIAWQFTSSLRIAGSGGKLDCNILYQPIETINTTQKVLRGTVTASTLNVREKPTTASKIVGYLKKSDIVTIIGTDIETGWYQIDTYAWVSNKYISIN